MRACLGVSAQHVADLLQGLLALALEQAVLMGRAAAEVQPQLLQQASATSMACAHARPPMHLLLTSVLQRTTRQPEAAG